MMENRLIIASAGSGKTTLLVNEALKANGNILITTYTEANQAEIKNKIVEINGYQPDNITVQTWFSFLLQHGVRPYQGVIYTDRIRGMFLTNIRSGLRFPNSTAYYAEEKDFKKHYFTDTGKIYSDKLSKFVVRCNYKSNGEVISRISRIYSHIYVDEVQDLAGYDLDILVLLFNSTTKVCLAGDPRQVTYLTHNEAKYSQYKDGKVKEFIEEKYKSLCKIDENTLKSSHRNNKEICDFSSKLYPQFPASVPCECKGCRSYITDHKGVFLVARKDLENYCKLYQPIVLKYSNAGEGEWNFGKSKGLGFNRVLIYPSATMIKYLKDGLLTKTDSKGITTNAFDKAKFYVALTRARHSVAIVHDHGDELYISGISKWYNSE